MTALVERQARLIDNIKDPTVLAFDFTDEKKHIHKEGYYEEFVRQAESHAKEAYGKVVTGTYDVGTIRLTPDGRKAIYLDAFKKWAHDSFMEPVEDESKPLWYREWTLNDVYRNAQIEKYINEGKIDSVWIDASPPPFQIDRGTRKRTGNMGDHTFWRLYQLNKNGDHYKLTARYVLHHLDIPEQLTLFSDLTKESVTEDSLMKTVGTLSPSLKITEIANEDSVSGIISKINTLYKATPLSRRLVPDDDLWFHLSEKHMNELLKIGRPLLTAIFLLMKHDVPDNFVIQEFHGWENLVQALVKREVPEDKIEYYSSLNPYIILKKYQDFINSLGSNNPQYGYEDILEDRFAYVTQEYVAVDGNCGSGSGFSQKNIFGALSLNITSPLGFGSGGLTDSLRELSIDPKEDPNLCSKNGCSHGPHFHCPDCDQRIDVGKGVSKCPGCGKGKTCG
jgi:hypothetical protein